MEQKWQVTKHGLYKQFNFTDFAQAFAFMTRVAELAERLQHHPRWENEWSVVQIWLITHDADSSITDKDRQMASEIDGLVEHGILNEDRSRQRQPKRVKLYSDGGSRGNPGPSACGYVIFDDDDKVLAEGGEYMGVTTNNQAEYNGLKVGLEVALRLGAREVDCYLDSLLVVNQMRGVFKIKNRELWPLHDAVKALTKQFKVVRFRHVPREQNKVADAAVNRALDEHLKKVV